MNQGDKQKFAEIMYGVADNFGGQISKEGLQMRFSVMADLSIQQIANAATFLIKHRKKDFPSVPTVKEFLDAVLVPEISPVSRAEIQADKVLAKLKYHGRAGKADFDDPITQDLMTVRWPYRSWACFVLEKDLVWWRKEFIAAYQAYSENRAVIELKRPTESNVIGVENIRQLSTKSVKTMEG